MSVSIIPFTQWAVAHEVKFNTRDLHWKSVNRDKTQSYYHPLHVCEGSFGVSTHAFVCAVGRDSRQLCHLCPFVVVRLYSDHLPTTAQFNALHINLKLRSLLKCHLPQHCRRMNYELVFWALQLITTMHMQWSMNRTSDSTVSLISLLYAVTKSYNILWQNIIILSNKIIRLVDYV